ncbi:hypothetical protein D3C87_1103920 [compost metagenome]
MPEFQTLGLRLRAEHIDDLVEEILNIDLVGIDLQAASLDLGNIQKPVDQAGEMVGGTADDLDGRLPRRGNGLIAFEDLGVAQNSVERRAQFVAEADHVAALGAVGGLSRFLGVLKGGVSLLVCGDFLQQQRVLA